MVVKRLCACLAMAMLCGGVAPAAAAPTKVRRVSDADLVRYAATKFDKGKMMFHRESVGLHRGILVVADYPCGDVCPAYTRRIVHYDVPVADCDHVGGIVTSEYVPRGPAVATRDFCKPAVLAGHRQR